MQKSLPDLRNVQLRKNSRTEYFANGDIHFVPLIGIVCPVQSGMREKDGTKAYSVQRPWHGEDGKFLTNL